MNEHRTPEEQQALDAQYMALALEEARAAGAAGEVPIGAVVVYEPIDRGTRRPLAEPRVIARGRNRREADRDPAGHAEFLAMKEAARVLDAWRLTDCTVYVTLEPCIMCAGLMHQARIARCVYGAPDQKAGAVGTLYDIHADGRLNHQFEVTGGVPGGRVRGPAARLLPRPAQEADVKSWMRCGRSFSPTSQPIYLSVANVSKI